MHSNFSSRSQTGSKSSAPPYHFAVKQYQFTDPQGLAVFHAVIILENQWGIPENITHLQDFIADGVTLSSPFEAYNKKRCLYFTGMLNFILIEQHEEYRARSVLDITHDMMQDFFNDYAGTVMEDGYTRKPATIWECVRVCTFTMYQLLQHYGTKMKITENELVVLKTFNNFRKEQVTKLVPVFSAHDHAYVGKDPVYREITTKAFELLLALAFKYASDIAFGICLQAFGGLRPGEVCCVRQEGSPLGPGITFTMNESGAMSPVIDLTKEYVLRSDNIPTGKIKKARKQKIYPDFEEAFFIAYDFHKRYLQSCKFEEQFAPMFINKHGMAMTYRSYAGKFDDLVKDHFIPALLVNEDRELQIYGHIIQHRSLDPHALRHFFTVQLVLRGLSAAQIMSWRGDTNIESANTYVMEKGELMKQATSVGYNLINILLQSGRREGN